LFFLIAALEVSVTDRNEGPMSQKRRSFIKQSAAAAISVAGVQAVANVAHAAGSDAPEKKK